jgi:hypothetical protein
MKARSKLIYVVAVDVEPEWEDEVNRWYNEEHIPNLLSVPGYLGARRYRAVDGGPTYLNYYEIASIEAFRSPERTRAIETPWTAKVRPHYKGQLAIYEQVFPADGYLTGAGFDGDLAKEGGLLLVRADAAPEQEQDFNDWYDQEHLLALSQVPGCIANRRFRAVEGGPRYMAEYHLTEPAVQTSDAWKKAIDTPWSARAREAFRNRWRTVYEPLGS